jgi:predicted  nucleic acid-binding Zn-ribbon protein
MQDNSFELLEAKVMTAVRRIQELKAENEVLAGRREELEKQVAALKDQVSRAEGELSEARQQAAVVAHWEDKRRLIEEKVGGLLETLESLD